MRRQFQAEGLATQVLPKEERLFRLWGAQQVHTDAMDDGRWVWTRPRFGYKAEAFHFESLRQQYKDWQRSQGVTDIVDVDTLADLPSEFLLSEEVNSIALFKDLENESTA